MKSNIRVYTKTSIKKILNGLAFDPRGAGARLILQDNDTFSPLYLVTRSLEDLSNMARTGKLTCQELDEVLQNLVMARVKMEPTQVGKSSK